MTTRAKGRGEKSPADDEFLQQLYRGGELLAAGKVIEAKEFLERAHQLQPRQEKAQNLLGLCYFKLGLFDRAAELYETLVRDNPVDPTLRVNLGLVYLKTNALQRAAREFETATDLAPEHQKAQNYLGLTLAQMGEYGRAREHFLLAGSEAMAEKMTRAIAGEGFSRAPSAQPARARGFSELEDGEQGGEPVAPPAPASGAAKAPAPERPQARAPGLAEGDWGAQFGLEGVGAATAEEEEEEIRLAEDEGPSALSSGGDGMPVLTATPEDPEAPATEAPHEPSRAASPDSEFEETSAALASSVPLTPVPLTRAQLAMAKASARAAAGLAPADGVAGTAAGSGARARSGTPASGEGRVGNGTSIPGEARAGSGASAPGEGRVGNGTSVPGEARGGSGAPASVGGRARNGAPAPGEAPASSDDVAGAVGRAAPERGAGTSTRATAVGDAGVPVSAGPVGGGSGVPAPASPVVGAGVPVSAGPDGGARAPVVALGGAARGLDTSVPALAELAPAVALSGADLTQPFTPGSGSFSVVVDGELLTRLEGMVAFTGSLTFQPEMKRFRGRATDKAFGEGAARMVRAKGRGVLHLEPADKRGFLAVDLGEDSAYFRDEYVFAFEEPVMFENGRVPSDIAPDLDLVHLRGQGKVLLSLPGTLRSVPVRAEQGVTVPLTHLVGWQGNLTPRVVPLLKSTTGEVLRTAVELGGEGFALIALGVR
jgi:uncharacterized protein (AIM24 family)